MWMCRKKFKIILKKTLNVYWKGEILPVYVWKKYIDTIEIKPFYGLKFVNVQSVHQIKIKTFEKKKQQRPNCESF